MKTENELGARLLYHLNIVFVYYSVVDPDLEIGGGGGGAFKTFRPFHRF